MPVLPRGPARLPSGVGPTDVLLRDGRIYAYGSALREAEPGVERVNAGGRLLAPAFVEAHLHLSLIHISAPTRPY